MSPAGVKGREGGYHEGVVAPECVGDAFVGVPIGLPSRDGMESTGPI